MEMLLLGNLLRAALRSVLLRAEHVATRFMLLLLRLSERATAVAVPTVTTRLLLLLVLLILLLLVILLLLQLLRVRCMRRFDLVCLDHRELLGIRARLPLRMERHATIVHDVAFIKFVRLERDGGAWLHTGIECRTRSVSRQRVEATSGRVVTLVWIGNRLARRTMC